MTVKVLFGANLLSEMLLGHRRYPLFFIPALKHARTYIKHTHTYMYMQDEATGLRYTNVKLLHRTLMNELNALQGAAVAGQKQSILEVMNSVLSSMDQSSIY